MKPKYEFESSADSLKIWSMGNKEDTSVTMPHAQKNKTCELFGVYMGVYGLVANRKLKQKNFIM